nr:hypothetical protein [Prevotella sp.]
MIKLNGDINAWEVKRQKKKYVPSLLEEKVKVMQSKIFKGRKIQMGCFSIEEM